MASKYKKKEKSEVKVPNNVDGVEKRILVISSMIGKLASVKTVTWSEELPNIADFDVVLMDLVSLYSEIENNTIELDDLNYPNIEAVANLVGSNGELIVIACPATHLEQGYCSKQLYWWSPIPIENRLERGSSIDLVKDTRFQEYIEQGIKKWFYYLDLIKREAKIKSDSVDIERLWLEYDIEPIALNRYGRPIAASFSLTAKRKKFFEKEVRATQTSGPVTILPPPTEFTIEEAIRLILAKLYGVALESVEPGWLRNYKVPGEDELEMGIRSSEQKIEEKKKKIKQKTKRLKDLTKFKKLLTETGDALEEIVWDTLEELGATVERPDEPNKEDGWFTDYKGRKAVLEIKGKMKSIATKDVRELDDWVSDRLEKGEEYKGILFGNHFRGDPLEKRGEAFPPDVIRFAEKKNQCIVTTTQLFEAFKRVKTGKMKAETIFDKLMETNGVCELITD